MITLTMAVNNFVGEESILTYGRFIQVKIAIRVVAVKCKIIIDPGMDRNRSYMYRSYVSRLLL